MNPVFLPLLPMVTAPGIAWFTPALDRIEAMAGSFIAELPQLLLGLIVFGIALRVARWGRDWSQSMVRASTKGGDDAGHAIGQLTYGAFVVVGVASAAAVMGIGLGHVLAGIGVSGVVAGFAFKDILENYLAGVLLLLTRPFHIGSSIKTGEFEGVVRSISTRSTVIETFDGQMVVVPNARIYSSPLTNLSALPNRRSTITVKVPCERDFDDNRSTIQAVAAGIPTIIGDPAPEILLVGLDEKTMQLEIRYWTARAEAGKAKSELLSALKTFLASGVAV